MVHSQFLKILGILILSHFATGLFSFLFFTSKMKSRNYTISFFGIFKKTFLDNEWIMFSLSAWLTLAVFWAAGAVTLAWSLRESMAYSGTIYPAIIANFIAMLVVNIFYMYFQVGELPTRNGWIALILIGLAILFAPNSGRNV